MIKITPTVKQQLVILNAQMKFRTLSDTVEFLLQRYKDVLLEKHKKEQNEKNAVITHTET